MANIPYLLLGLVHRFDIPCLHLLDDEHYDVVGLLHATTGLLEHACLFTFELIHVIF
jgi:hypothetical protein